MAKNILNDYSVRKALFEESEKIRVGKVKALKNTKSTYDMPGDVELTAEQKAEIDAFWGKYSFIDEMNYKDFKVFFNRSGVFSPYYVPYYFNKFFLRPNLVPESYQHAFQNKAYLHKIMPNAKQPKMVIRRVEGIYYDDQFRKITLDEAVDICYDRLESGKEIVVKPSGKSGGAGVVFFAEATKEELRDVLRKKGRLFIVQEAIKQHPEMAKLNPTTVNTVRMTSLLLDDEVIPVAALIKVGSPKARVDNFKHGGVLLGVNMDGTVQPWGLNVARERVTELPSGIKLGEGGFERVPCWESVLDTVKRAHYDTPKIKLISWDVAIDDENEAEIIECNYAGDLRMHQVLTGPVLGEYIGPVLEKYVLPKISRPGMNENYDYEEFYDHIVITRYAGEANTVIVPDTIAEKPVTVIGAVAFQFNEDIKKVVLPATIKTVRAEAFMKCKNLETIEADFDAISFGKSVAGYCSKLDKAIKSKIKK